MEKKTLNHHLMVIKGLLKIAIDLERWFCTNQELKRQNRAPELTGDRKDRARLEAPRATIEWPRGTRRFGPGFVPWPPAPLEPIYTPLGF